MSALTMGQVWGLKLPHAQMLVLLAMADHADHEGRNIYPSMGLIAWKTGYSRRHVIRIVQKLIDQQLLIVEEELDREPVKYQINLDAGPLKPKFRHPRQNVTSDKMSPAKPSRASDKMSPASDIAMSPKVKGRKEGRGESRADQNSSSEEFHSIAPIAYDRWVFHRSPALLVEPDDRLELESLALQHEVPTGGHGDRWAAIAIVQTARAHPDFRTMPRERAIALVRGVMVGWKRRGDYGSGARDDLIGGRAPAQNKPARAPSLLPSLLGDDHPAVLAYSEAFPGCGLETDQFAAIVGAVAESSLPAWRAVLDEWKLNGWKPTAIGNMLDRFRKRAEIKEAKPAPAWHAELADLPRLIDEAKARGDRDEATRLGSRWQQLRAIEARGAA